MRVRWLAAALLGAIGPAAGAGEGDPPAFPGGTLSFQENQGLTDPRVKYFCRAARSTVFLTAKETVVLLSRVKEPDEVARAALRLSLDGSNPAAAPAGAGKLATRFNYYSGNNAARWRRDVPAYSEVRYEKVYRGIDLVCRGGADRVKYDFVLASGADPKDIKIRFEGADEVSLGKDGELVAKTAAGDFVMPAPVLYQESGGVRKEVSGAYKLRGKDRVGFDVGDYDKDLVLVIDPVLLFSTFLGGSGRDGARAVAADAQGFAYLTGRTTSLDFPTSAGVQPALQGVQDAFVAKLDPANQTLAYATYLGGSDFEEGKGIAVDGAGNAYVVGHTASSDFPYSDFSAQGGNDGFIVKLDVGGGLGNSFPLGGPGHDFAFGVAVDPDSGHAWVTGETDSASFVAAEGSTRIGPPGGQEVFVARVSGAVEHVTFVGGSGADRGSAIAVNLTGVYVTGQTTSADFPAPGGRAGPSDAFVFRLGHNGATLEYARHLGGSGSERGNGIGVDPSGNAYVVGDTTSVNFPKAVESGSTFGGLEDGFYASLDPAGALRFATYLGGRDRDEAKAVALDGGGQFAAVTGRTFSLDFPLAGPFQQEHGGFSDAFVAFFDLDSRFLRGSSYLGGSGADSGLGTAVAGGKAFVAGETTSPDFPVRSAFQGTFGGESDAFLAVVGPETLTTTEITVVTNAEGVAVSSRVVLPESPGPSTIEAALLDPGVSPVVFTVTALSPAVARTLPAPVIVSPPSGGLFSADPIVSGTASEGGLEITLWVNGEPASGAALTDAARNWSIPLQLAEGKFEVRARARDSNGNTSGLSNGVTVTKDATPPTVHSAHPAPGSTTTNVRPLILARWSDGTTAVDPATALITLDGQDVTGACDLSSTGFRFVPASALAGGTRTVAVRVADLANNLSATFTWSFTVDAPAVAPPPVVPLPPTNVRVTAYFDAVDVEWDRSPSPNVAGYRVYRRVGLDGAWEPLTGTQLVLNTKYRDAPLTTGQSYFYRVTAVGSAP